MSTTWPDALEGELGVAGLPLNHTSTALRSNDVIKAAAGTLYGLSGLNAYAADLYLLLFDAAAVPADGTMADVTYLARAGDNMWLDWGRGGRYFTNGICWAASSTAPTKTLSVSQLWLDAQYV